MDMHDNLRIGIVGLGYVGLPLAIEFSKHFEVVGFDINPVRIQELKSGIDKTREVESHELNEAIKIDFSSDEKYLEESDVLIVTVPTPIKDTKQPDLSPLISASELIGRIIKTGTTVIYESTVYPGATEEECVPIIEKISGLSFNRDFFVGYSPERINPGDKNNKLATIMKVTSGSTEVVSEFVDQLYKKIVTAGTYKATSIRVAEAAKVIENTQRDLNIALMNELAIIFDKLEIDTEEVLLAAGTKWNFLPFKPGLVGGHCIGIDPYYLTYKSEKVGYIPDMILAGRRINDGMSSFITSKLMNSMIKNKIHIKDSNILIMGYSFKEDCPDIRNTRVNDIVTFLGEFGANVDIYDPIIISDEVIEQYGYKPLSRIEKDRYDAIIIAVAHSVFKKMTIEEVRQYGKNNHVVFDVKNIFDKSKTDIRL